MSRFHRQKCDRSIAVETRFQILRLDGSTMHSGCHQPGKSPVHELVRRRRGRLRAIGRMVKRRGRQPGIRRVGGLKYLGPGKVFQGDRQTRVQVGRIRFGRLGRAGGGEPGSRNRRFLGTGVTPSLGRRAIISALGEMMSSPFGVRVRARSTLDGLGMRRRDRRPAGQGQRGEYGKRRALEAPKGFTCRARIHGPRSLSPWAVRGNGIGSL